jgi:quinol monooxygenase YgiN
VCRFLQLVFALTFAAATGAASAQTPSSAVDVATYVEVVPSAVATGTALLKQYRAASRKQDGNLRFDVLQELERPSRFAIVEAWRDPAAHDAHVQAASTKEFRDKLSPIQAAPPDERITSALYTAQGRNKSQPGEVYVLTHVDVIPAGKDDAMAALKTMNGDSAADQGNITHEVWQQANRANHFTVVESWTSRKMLDSHASALHTRAFRNSLAKIAGALYDERFYAELNDQAHVEATESARHQANVRPHGDATVPVPTDAADHARRSGDVNYLVGGAKD